MLFHINLSLHFYLLKGFLNNMIHIFPITLKT